MKVNIHDGKRTTRMGYTAILIALAMIFSYIEAVFPFSWVTLPGFKIGIANLVIVVAMYSMDFKMALGINVLRVILVGFLFTGAFGILYSMGGCVLSLAGMGLLKKTGKFSILGVSMAGGVLHNTGQLIVAAIILTSTKTFFYFPVLLFTGMGTGLVIGYMSYIILSRLKLMQFN